MYGTRGCGERKRARETDRQTHTQRERSISDVVGWWYRSDGQALARGINATSGGVTWSSSRCGVTPASPVEHTVVVIEAGETDGMIDG